ncbi:hypothetical protein V6N13_102469 [Hibiscus sabdariffa]
MKATVKCDHMSTVSLPARGDRRDRVESADILRVCSFASFIMHHVGREFHGPTLSIHVSVCLRWAARVLVNSEEACHHGRKDVGLPSQVARFSKRITPIPRQTKDRIGDFLNKIGVSTTSCHSKDCMDVQVTEVLGPAPSDICNIKFTTDVPTPKFNKWMGPSIRMSLPSFSGHTEYNPNLLKYSCRLACRVRAVRPAKISGPSPLKKERNSESESTEFTAEEATDNGRNLSISVMLSKPILALEFNCLEMQVEAPIILSNNSTSSLPSA